MADIGDIPHNAAHGGKNALSKVPKWGYVVVAVGGGYFIYRRRQANAAASAAATLAASNSNATPPAAQGSTNQSDPYGSSGYGMAGGIDPNLMQGASTVTTTTPADATQGSAGGADLAGTLGALTPFVAAIAPNGVGGGAPSSQAAGVVTAPPPPSQPTSGPAVTIINTSGPSAPRKSTFKPVSRGALAAREGRRKPPAKKGYTIVGTGDGGWQYVPDVRDKKAPDRKGHR